MLGVEVWVIAGRAKKRKYYPLHEVSQQLTQPVRENLLIFHVLTGCDTTSVFSGHGKRSCWKKFQKHTVLVSGFGYDEGSHQVNNLCVTYMVHRNSQQPTISDCSCLVRPRMVWICCLQLMMLWNLIHYVPIVRQRSGYKQTKNTDATTA